MKTDATTTEQQYEQGMSPDQDFYEWQQAEYQRAYATLPEVIDHTTTDPRILSAVYQVLCHTPSEDTYGHTCDERGCAICNAGSRDEAARDLVVMAIVGDRWDDEVEQAADAAEILAAGWAEHGWDTEV